MDDEAVTRQKKLDGHISLTPGSGLQIMKRSILQIHYQYKQKKWWTLVLTRVNLKLNPLFFHPLPDKKKKNDFVLFIPETEQTTTDL